MKEISIFRKTYSYSKQIWLHILLIDTLSSQKLKPRQTKFAEAIPIAVRETDNGKWLISKLLL
jgi:hypothetical protein